ncbi:MAG: hypothetical protein R2939_22270 [Kofleriaceae bacterium]
MSSGARFELSVILPFADDEEQLGATVRQTVAALRGRAAAFELLAIDEDSGDNSHAVLAILRPETPELRVLHAPTRGRGVEVGVARAQGAVIAIVAPGLPEAQQPALWAAIERVRAGDADVEFAIGQFIVAHRGRSLDAFHGARLAGEPSQRRLAKRLGARGFRVRVDGATLPPPSGPTTPRPRSWREAFVLRRAS